MHCAHWWTHVHLNGGLEGSFFKFLNQLVYQKKLVIILFILLQKILNVIRLKQNQELNFEKENDDLLFPFSFIILFETKWYLFDLQVKSSRSNLKSSKQIFKFCREYKRLAVRLWKCLHGSQFDFTFLKRHFERLRDHSHMTSPPFLRILNTSLPHVTKCHFFLPLAPLKLRHYFFIY